MRLRSRTEFPPGGWTFYQPQTNWTAPPGTFDEVCMAIRNMRLANPRHKLPTELDTINLELEYYTLKRIGSLPGAQQYITEGGPGLPKTWPPRSQPAAEPAAAAGTVAASVAKVSAGAWVIRDWVGAGGRPVASALANQRASKCVACPKNRQSSWTEWAKDRIAESIRLSIEIKNQMDLRTPYDNQIKTCDACLCWLPLKVWCPITHIVDNMSPEVEKQLHPACWVLAEKK